MFPRDLQDNFYHPTKIWTLLFYRFLLFFKDRFCCEMINERRFLYIVDLSFDARFVKYYQFSSHYYKRFPINNIKVKCSQIGQNVSGTFLTCFLESLWQIERIADFITLAMLLWPLITTTNFTNEWGSINLYTF